MRVNAVSKKDNQISRGRDRETVIAKKKKKKPAISLGVYIFERSLRHPVPSARNPTLYLTDVNAQRNTASMSAQQTVSGAHAVVSGSQSGPTFFFFSRSPKQPAHGLHLDFFFRFFFFFFVGAEWWPRMATRFPL